MNPWKWFKRKTLGESVKDYGQVLEWKDWGGTHRLRLQLTRADKRFFLVARTSSSAFLSKEIAISRMPVSPDLLDRFSRIARDAAETIRSAKAGQDAAADTVLPRHHPPRP